MVKVEQISGEGSAERKVIPSEEKPAFDYKEAIDNRDFLDFLAKYKDVESLEISEENQNEIKKRYEDFENRTFAAERLFKIYKQELEPAFEIKLNPAHFNAISEYLEKEALENPDQLSDRVYEIKAYVELKSEKEKLEKEIVELGGEQNIEKARQEIAAQKLAAEKQHKIGKWAIGWRGMVNPKSWAFVDAVLKPKYREIRQTVRESKPQRTDFFKRADEKIKKFSEKEIFLNNYPTIKAATEAILENLKINFFENFEPAKAIIDEAANDITDKLKEFLIRLSASGEPMKTLEWAQKYLDKARAAKSELPLGDLRHLPLDAFQDQLDQRFEQLVSESIFRTIGDFKIGNQPLQAMRESLKSHLSREKLGSKGRQKVKNFISAVIAEQIAGLLREKPQNYNQKIMLLKVILTDIAAYE